MYARCFLRLFQPQVLIKAAETLGVAASIEAQTLIFEYYNQRNNDNSCSNKDNHLTEFSSPGIACR